MRNVGMCQERFVSKSQGKSARKWQCNCEWSPRLWSPPIYWLFIVLWRNIKPQLIQEIWTYNGQITWQGMQQKDNYLISLVWNAKNTSLSTRSAWAELKMSERHLPDRKGPKGFLWVVNATEFILIIKQGFDISNFHFVLFIIIITFINIILFHKLDK